MEGTYTIEAGLRFAVLLAREVAKAVVLGFDFRGLRVVECWRVQRCQLGIRSAGA